MYDRILVPTDGSPYAEAAADTALSLAAELDAMVHALCVIETGPLGSVDLPGDTASADEVLGERGQEYVDRIESRGDDRGVPVTTVVRKGVPVREILSYVEEVDADVVVMGTRGRGGISRMLLGSVTDAVTRHCDRDVLVVGDREVDESEEF